MSHIVEMHATNSELDVMLSRKIDQIPVQYNREFYGLRASRIAESQREDGVSAGIGETEGALSDVTGSSETWPHGGGSALLRRVAAWTAASNGDIEAGSGAAMAEAKASAAGASASTMVRSPGCAPPISMTPSTAAMNARDQSCKRRLRRMFQDGGGAEQHDRIEWTGSASHHTPNCGGQGSIDRIRRGRRPDRC